MRQLCHEWLQRIKSVELEQRLVRHAVDLLLMNARADPTVLRPYEHRDIVAASEGLEATYFIRLFAEFETGLRSYWSSIRPTDPPSAALLDGVAARRRVPDDLRAGAHSVREYRNQLVHDRDEETHAFTVAEARSMLCRFFARLPEFWED